MMKFGVTPQGFNKMTLDDVLNASRADFIAAFGETFVLKANSPLGQIHQILSEREASVWEKTAEVYYSSYPETASGISLSRVATLSGIRRLSAEATILEAVTIFGRKDTEVKAGALTVSVRGKSAYKFRNRSAFKLQTRLGESEEWFEVVLFVAIEQGLWEVLGTDILEIDTPISGIYRTSLDSKGIRVGRDIETDEEFRIRRILTIGNGATGNVDGLYARLSTLKGVKKAIVFSNRTDVTTANGIPPHSVEVVIQAAVGSQTPEYPKLKALIAKTIWENLAAGIQTYTEIGAQGQPVRGEYAVHVDSQGQKQDILWSNAEEIIVYVTVVLTVNPDIFRGTVDLVTEAVVDYGAGIGQGDGIYAPYIISKLAATFAGIKTVRVAVGKDPRPAESMLELDPRQVAVFDKANISVVGVHDSLT